MIGSKLSLMARGLIALGAMSLVMLIAFAWLGWYGSTQFAAQGFEAAAVACGLSWLAGVAALTAITVCHHLQYGVHGLLLGTIFRMAIPLSAGIVLHKSHSDLLQAGIIGMLTGTYLLGLFVETLLACWILDLSTNASPHGIAKAS